MTRAANLLTAVLLLVFAGSAADGSAAADDAARPAPDFATHVAPILTRYCTGCHSADDASGELAVHDFAALMQGGEGGAVLVPGDPDASRLMRVIEKAEEPFMPPEGEAEPTADEVALLRAWIAAGARGPEGDMPRALTVPRIEPTADVRQSVHAAAYSPDGRWAAVARYGSVEILSGEDHKPVRVLEGHAGHVNDVGFSADGSLLFVAAGEPGLFGELTLWNTADWARSHTLRGHGDSLYAAAISPDGALLATGSYDQTVRLWDAATGEERRVFTAHNGPVFGLAFHPAGRILASASGDRTVKLWDVATGGRLDTFSQPEKEQYAVAFSPDGARIAAGGADNRIRVWDVSDTGREGTNLLLQSRFAHEEAIVRLVFSPDGRVLVSAGEDRAIKFWETAEFTQLRVLRDQSDWPAALAIAPDNRTLLVGRLDGTLSAVPLDTAEEGIAYSQPLRTLPEPKPHEGPRADDLPQVAEVEPNDRPDQATPLPVPGKATGVLHPQPGAAQDVDLYRFEAAAGQSWIIETHAARSGSPADTKIEVLHEDGRLVERLLLQAVRDSWIEFRPIDSNTVDVRVKNWEEMDLDQYVYMNGEVGKIFRMPQGPDSGINFYAVNGRRRCYFDTSATIQPLDAPVYIVEPHLPGATLVDNGLPVFPLYYANDDDGDRKLGSDSRLTFTAPEAGAYLVRVTDVRGFGGEDYTYTLTVREPRPDFSVAIEGGEGSVGAGSGKRLVIKVDRHDGFEGEVRVDVAGIPPGYSVPSPIVVEAGHREARAVLNAAPNAKPMPPDVWKQVQVRAAAEIHGETVVREAGDLGELALAERPNVIARLDPDRPDGSERDPAQPHELTIAPGTTITAMLSIERHGFDGELRFDVDNLPHGVIVDNIGLSGIMVRAGETERRIHLTAAEWVPETIRWIHAVSQQEGNQASLPILLRVNRGPQPVASR